MNVEVSEDTCIGSGQCVLTAPAVFDQRDEDALVQLLDPAPPAEQWPVTRNAAAGCPAGAIRIEE